MLVLKGSPMRRDVRNSALAVLVLTFAGCTTAPAPAPPPAPAVVRGPGVGSGDPLNAILWTQTAVEHHALCLQAYRLAREKLDAALKDPSWTAAVEQTGDFAKLPPAVILDVDETVLDHGAYGAQNILDGVFHSGERWNAWLDSGKAEALPGAVEFTRYAASKGVAVFYVSNTELNAKPLVRKILVARGFPVKDAPDSLMFKGEQPDWTGDKASRRAYLARRYRIALLIGDDFNDFAGVVDAPLERRQQVSEERNAWWGERWIVLPNPAYGSWERAVLRGARTPEDRHEMRMKGLRGWK
jgi:acid phosphatase